MTGRFYQALVINTDALMAPLLSQLLHVLDQVCVHVCGRVHEKHVHFAALELNILNKSIKSIWSNASFKTTVSLLNFVWMNYPSM